MRKDLDNFFPKQLQLWMEGDILKYKVKEKELHPSKIDLLKSNKEFFKGILKDTKSKNIKVLPLAQNQKALCFLHSVNPGAVSYNISLAAELLNPINIEAFKRAFSYLTSRHPLLRTIFANLPGSDSIPFQIVLDEISVGVEQIDGINLSNEQIKNLLNEKYRVPFNLETGPLFRITIVNTTNSTILSFNFHHIICDAISLRNLLKEFIDIYDSLIQNRNLSLANSSSDYSNFIFDQMEFLNSETGESQINYWEKHLTGKQFILNLPTKFERPPLHQFNGSTFLFKIEGTRFHDLRLMAKNNNTTFNVLLLSVFEFFISKISGQKEFCVGLPAAARINKDYEDIFGYFINLLPLGCSLNSQKSFIDFLDKNKINFYESLENQGVPFPIIVERLAPKRDLSWTPIFQVIFNYLNKKSLDPLLHFLGDSETQEYSSWGSLSVKPYEIFDQEGQVDLTMEIIDDDNELLCALKYNTDLFDNDTIIHFSEEFIKIIDLLINDSDLKPLWLSDESIEKSEKPVLNVNITGTFTVEPVKPYLEYWLEKFNVTYSIKFPGYNQVFSQLLNPGSDFNLNRDGYNILLVRFEDWIMDKRSQKSDPDFITKIDEFENALSFALQINSGGKYILALCPPSPLILNNTILSEIIDETEKRISSFLKTKSNVLLLKSGELLDTYDVYDYYDEMGEEAGHIPFSDEFFISLSTIIARKIHVFLSSPFKAIAVDCDNTIWKGVVAEDGPMGVKIGPEEKELQEFLIEQSESGILICLCSKNREEDVFEVFEKNNQMILKKTHVAFHKINWNPKSENLIQLAKDINIGLDSFVFLDDSPMECAEVRNNAQDVLTIQLPGDGFSKKQLRNSWIFDRLSITEEDRKRSEKYKEEAVRSNFKASAKSYHEFIKGLNLKIDIKPFREENIPRISQLTYRTNQFNFTTLRKSEGEIFNISNDKNYESFQVTLSDRFGDYGLIGVIIVNKFKGYSVETFLLSCRVLGKGVEHFLISYLGERAKLNNSDYLTINFSKTTKNIPTGDFLISNFGDLDSGNLDNMTFNIPYERAAGFAFDPESNLSNQEIPEEEKAKAITENITYRDRNDFYFQILDKFISFEGIVAELNKSTFVSLAESTGRSVGHRQTEINVMSVWQQLLKRDDFNNTDNFFNIGGHSVLIPQIVIKLYKQFNIKINIVDIFQYPTVRKLSAFIDGSNIEEVHKMTPEESMVSRATTKSDIAVIGMACRFPGAKNLNEYWNNLIEGKETIKHFTDDELSKFEINYNDLKNNPDYVKARGVLEDIDKFDAGFFEMTPKEATLTDPQHRVWLENAWDAFENAGCNPINFPGAVGVFAGGFINTYLFNNILRDPVKLGNYIRMRTTESLEILTGNDIAHIPTKTAYKFNLRGPAINVQTACSTSLVAISQACKSLFSYESDICLAGGVFIMVPQEMGYIYQEGAITSPDGSCRPFDAKGKGTVFSNGVGAVILKRLDDAIRDRDNIYAIVKGWAINNDGKNKISYLAPSIDGQAEVIMMAQSSAEISPEQISYIEAHGTATQLGDPIKIAALNKTFSKGTDKKQFCGIGSVKSNIGRTDAAAGVASFIKTSLAAYHRVIPPSIHFSNPNKLIKFEDTPFFIQSELKEWNDEKPLIMGVSSFGIGGTNAHVIVKEPPRIEKTPALPSEWPELLLLSAKTEYSLNKRIQDLIEFMKTNPNLNLHDVVYTLGTGRNHMLHRSFLVTSGLEEILSGKSNFTDGIQNNLVSGIAFMFPGQGAQYVGMGRDLYNTNRLFRQILDECIEIVKSETGQDLKKILFEINNSEDADRKLASTEMTQPALFIIEYALAKVLEQINIKPDYLIGHSIGEYTAACVAGVFDLHTALRIVIKKGQLMQRMPSGKMLAVRTSSEKLRSLNSTYFEIAGDNSPASCSISFKTENKRQVEHFLASNGITYIGLNTSHAFHSEAFDPIISEFSVYVNQFTLKTPELPFISCLTGKFITDEEAVSGAYWAKQLRNTVLFRQGISTIAKTEDVIFLEVGPETHLSSLVRHNEDLVNKNSIISTLGKFDHIDERYKILTALGNMFTLGVNIDVEALMKDARPGKISLPTYPYERKRHWIDFELAKDFDKLSSSSKLLKGSSEINDGKIDEKVSTLENTDKVTMREHDLKVFTHTEQIIFNIRSEAFMNKDISLMDNFFEIGGDSLLAITVMSKIKSAFKVDLSLRVFIDSPIIKDLAEKVDAVK
ncbi:MAG: HAD-IIIC family phosphatase [Bacteroidetes bacterium]|nr:HAD-IIIC family phosphatase [Bacteroidota bacterium]